LAAGAFAVM